MNTRVSTLQRRKHALEGKLSSLQATVDEASNALAANPDDGQAQTRLARALEDLVVTERMAEHTGVQIERARKFDSADEEARAHAANRKSATEAVRKFSEEMVANGDELDAWIEQGAEILAQRQRIGAACRKAAWTAWRGVQPADAAVRNADLILPLAEGLASPVQGALLAALKKLGLPDALGAQGIITVSGVMPGTQLTFGDAARLQAGILRQRLEGLFEGGLDE